jgi:hypothetical protein
LFVFKGFPLACALVRRFASAGERIPLRSENVAGSVGTIYEKVFAEGWLIGVANDHDARGGCFWFGTVAFNVVQLFLHRS